MIMSLKCQSINSKYDNLIIFIEELKNVNFEFSVICVQESWLDCNADLSLFQINHYQCISKGKSSSKHGGLIIYLHEKYDYSISLQPEISDLWEGLFIKVRNPVTNKNIDIGNVYRRPKENNNNETVTKFIEEFNPILDKMSNSNSVIVGDFNLDLLKIKDKNVINDYLENILSFGFNPKIIYPTRLAHQSATLIDNIFSNESHNMSSVSGIIISNISDHFPCFSCLENQNNFKSSSSTKYVYYREINEANIKLIFDFLCSYNLLHKLRHLQTDDPNFLYNYFEDVLTSTINKFSPLQKKKYNKYKTKTTNWITFGIIKSIKYIDRIYKNCKKFVYNSLEYQMMKQHLKKFNTVLKKTINKAKELYYGDKFKQNKGDIKQTWNTINQIIKRNN